MIVCRKNHINPRITELRLSCCLSKKKIIRRSCCVTNHMDENILSCQVPSYTGERKGVETMPGACGVACEICMFPGMGLCTLGDGCGPGTDPRAHEWIEKIRAGRSTPCYILECAVKNTIDYCSNCEKFPCDVHYEQQIYSHRVLDLTKKKLGLIK